MRLCRSIVYVVVCCGVLVTADGYKRETWLVAGEDSKVGDSVIVPSSYRQHGSRRSRDMADVSDTKYAFRPRAIPLRTDQSQERNIYYSKDNKYKTEILFPGNYFTIAKEKSNENLTGDSGYTLSAEPFKPKAIPLMRGQDFQKRSLDVQQSGKESEDTSVMAMARRSLSYVLGVDEDEDNEEEEGDEEIEDDGEYQKESKSKIKHKLKKAKKYSKYMMPLLLAYKLKYFALVPVMIAGLILLVGATGMAGFFFALFAAVMGLQKGGY